MMPDVVVLIRETLANRLLLTSDGVLGSDTSQTSI